MRQLFSQLEPIDPIFSNSNTRIDIYLRTIQGVHPEISNSNYVLAGGQLNLRRCRFGSEKTERWVRRSRTIQITPPTGIETKYRMMTGEEKSVLKRLRRRWMREDDEEGIG